jgi:hypothetical protein
MVEFTGVAFSILDWMAPIAARMTTALPTTLSLMREQYSPGGFERVPANCFT